MAKEQDVKKDELKDKFSLFNDQIAAVVFGEGGEEAAEDVIFATAGIKARIKESLDHERIQWLPGDKASILDAHCIDENGRHSDIEVQSKNTDDLLRRARFYGSQLDILAVKPGMTYASIPDVFIVFICNKSPFKDNEVRHTITTYDIGKREIVDTGKVYIFFSADIAAKYGNEAEKRIALDFLAKNMEELSTQSIIKRVKSKRKKIVDIMKYTEDIKQQSYDKGRKEGMMEAMVENILAIVSKGLLAIDEACAALGVSEEIASEAKRRLAEKAK